MMNSHLNFQIRVVLVAILNLNLIFSAIVSADNIENGKYAISFYRAIIDDGAYSNDDSNKAPDPYLVIKDKYGNTVLNSSEKFIIDENILSFVTNRNNYRPDFKGITLQYYFEKDTILVLDLYDWDGFEGKWGVARSANDKIGSSCEINKNCKIGKQWKKTDGWAIEFEVVPLL